MLWGRTMFPAVDEMRDSGAWSPGSLVELRPGPSEPPVVVEPTPGRRSQDPRQPPTGGHSPPAPLPPTGHALEHIHIRLPAFIPAALTWCLKENSRRQSCLLIH